MDKTTKTILGVIVLALVVWGVASGVKQKGEQTGKETGPIKVGFYGSLTGDAASIGEVALAATQMAVGDVNAAGGVNGRQLELIVEDSACNSGGGTNAVNKLVNVDKVTAIVGGLCSGETAPAAPIAQNAGVPMVSYCSSAPGISNLGDYIFRTYPSDAFQSVYAAEYAYNNLNKRKAAVLYIKTDWGQGLHDGFTTKFKELGGAVVYAESFPQGTADFRSHVSKIKATTPDLVYFVAYNEAAIPGLKQMNELGLSVPVLGGDGFDDVTIPQGAGSAAEGVMYTVPKSEIDENFKTRLMSEKGKEAGLCSPNAYDTVKILAKVMSENGTKGEAIKKGLEELKDYKGVSGNISFDKNGDLTEAHYQVKVMRGGKLEVLSQ